MQNLNNTPRHRRYNAVKKEIYKLLKQGYSIRQIMKKMGWKSPRAVSYYL